MRLMDVRDSLIKRTHGERQGKAAAVEIGWF